MQSAALLNKKSGIVKMKPPPLCAMKENRNWKPVNLDDVKTYPIRNRINKVSVRDFAAPISSQTGIHEYLSRLPKILKAADLLELANLIAEAYRRQKPIIVMAGGHVVKCGLSTVLIDLMERGIVTALVCNGATSIHDFEIALIGETSEDVGRYLQSGEFGMVEETGRYMNEAFSDAAAKGVGMGEGLGLKLIELEAHFQDKSLLAAACRLGIPVTVHVAIGTDIIHQHPTANGAAIGETSFTDFRILTAVVAELGNGGVILNLGSAVILPEVFLKALTIARNLGHHVTHFTTADFDMIQQYRPLENVVKRPTTIGGKGFTFTGHHEIMIPLLAGAIVERIGESTE